MNESSAFSANTEKAFDFWTTLQIILPKPNPPSGALAM